jgi:hypothetical protein
LAISPTSDLLFLQLDSASTRCRRGQPAAAGAPDGGRIAVAGGEAPSMRMMLLIWTAVIGGGLAYFIVVGLTHS